MYYKLFNTRICIITLIPHFIAFILSNFYFFENSFLLRWKFSNSALSKAQGEISHLSKEVSALKTNQDQQGNLIRRWQRKLALVTGVCLIVWNLCMERTVFLGKFTFFIFCISGKKQLQRAARFIWERIDYVYLQPTAGFSTPYWSLREIYWRIQRTCRESRGWSDIGYWSRFVSFILI